MKQQTVEPVSFVEAGGELSLSGPAFVEILGAVLDKRASFRFRARGFSMSPFIKDDNIVTVSSLTGAPPRKGDVAAFIRTRTGNLVVHRVIGKRGDTFLMKGDNAAVADGTVPAANILGRVTGVERNGKKVFAGLGPEGFLIAFLSRSGLLLTLILPVSRFVRRMIKRLTL